MMSMASRQLSQLIVAKLLVLHHLSLTSSILKCHSDNLYYNILVPSRRLRILAVLSSGCKATPLRVCLMFIAPLQHIKVAELPCLVGKIQRIFIFGQLKVIQLFHIPRFTNSQYQTLVTATAPKHFQPSK